jgi:hypothetical protein
MLSCLAQASTAALVALVLVGAARADTIKTFDVKGTAKNVSHMDLGSCEEDEFCSFSGTLMVDVTGGKVTAVDITFPGLPSFARLTTSGTAAGLWNIHVFNNVLPRLSLALSFTTIPTRGSLVGFDGGRITFGTVGRRFGVILIYKNLSGSITPVPEPSSRALLGPGLLCCVGFGLVRRRNKAALMYPGSQI